MERFNASRSNSGIASFHLIDGPSAEREVTIRLRLLYGRQGASHAQGFSQKYPWPDTPRKRVIRNADKTQERQSYHHGFTAQTFELEAPRPAQPVRRVGKFGFE